MENTHLPANLRKKGVVRRMRAVLRRVSQRMLRVDGGRSGNGAQIRGNGRMRSENGGVIGWNGERKDGNGALGLGMTGFEAQRWIQEITLRCDFPQIGCADLAAQQSRSVCPSIVCPSIEVWRDEKRPCFPQAESKGEP